MTFWHCPPSSKWASLRGEMCQLRAKVNIKYRPQVTWQIHASSERMTCKQRANDTQAREVALASTIAIISRCGLWAVWHKSQHSHRFVLWWPATKKRKAIGDKGSVTCMSGYFVGWYKAVFVKRSQSHVQHMVGCSVISGQLFSMHAMS